MSKKIHFNDALDYIFITNDSGKNSYLITGDTGLTSAISVTAAAAAAATATVAVMGASTAKHSIPTTTATTTSTTGAILMSSATTMPPPSQSSMSALPATSGGGDSGAGLVTAAVTVENLYDVAVNLGAMLINNTMLTFDNGTTGHMDMDMGIGTLFDDILNATELNTNITIGNATSTEDDFTDLLKMVATSAVLGLMILITIIGNVFVIAAIILERNLQNVANYLVASLAVADLFVACLVMPLGAVYEISEGWILGPELCDIWTSCDVLCCTASILHLVAIAVDRYWAVTNIDYIHSRTSRRVFMMIICVWSAAVIVSLAPQFGWKDPDYLQRIEQQKCMVSQDVAYQVFATCCTFYVPLFVILVLYWKIYQTARKRIHRRRPKPFGAAADKNNQPNVCLKKRKHLRLRLGKFSTTTKSDNGNAAVSGKNPGKRKGEHQLGLVEGNSTNTINTVEDTEFSSSNVDGKSRAGIEVTTQFRNTEELEVPSSEHNEISTVSNLVALASQQHTKTLAEATAEQQPHQHQHQLPGHFTDEKSTLRKSKTITTTPTTPTTTKGPDEEQEIIETDDTNKSTNAEVLQDPHIHNQQLQESQQHSFTKVSNATTTTSISAISPETPPTLMAPTYSQNSQLSSSVNASSQVTPIASIKTAHQQTAHLSNPVYKMTKRKETLEAKRERKAAKTLAIITGAFVVCWLPFFVMALMMPLCAACEINDSIASFFLWLGYFNSTLNPVIYTIFSPEFRQAFKRILFGGHRPVHYRSGKI